MEMDILKLPHNQITNDYFEFVRSPVSYWFSCKGKFNLISIS